MRVEYHPAIEGELRQIIDFYNERSRGLGNQFLDEFEKQILNIASMPSRWLVVGADVRRSLMKRFPYVIYFRPLEDSVLRVTVIKHQRRHPGYGRRRK
jgi:plasmid stabilization system protein ParE